MAPCLPSTPTVNYRVDYRGDNRIVRLSRGEVNFDVAKDPHRPFVVYAGDGLVWAVGTAFNVRLLEERACGPYRHRRAGESLRRFSAECAYACIGCQ